MIIIKGFIFSCIDFFIMPLMNYGVIKSNTLGNLSFFVSLNFFSLILALVLFYAA